MGIGILGGNCAMFFLGETEIMEYNVTMLICEKMRGVYMTNLGGKAKDGDCDKTAVKYEGGYDL